MAADTFSGGVVPHHTLPDQTSTDERCALPNRLERRRQRTRAALIKAAQGFVVAVVAVGTMAVVLLQHRGYGHAVEALYLIGVLVVSVVCEPEIAVATSLGSAIALLYTHAGQYELDAAVVAGLFLVVALPTNFVADSARRVVRHAGRRRREAEQIAAIFKAAPSDLSLLAQQHHALRRAATLVADLIASRARLVAAFDEARRRLERDLHDTAQQRLVSLRLKLRAAVTSVPDELVGLKKVLAEVASDLTDVTTELQEISRGIHPAVLSKGGLAPALRALANRSAIPAKVAVAIEGPVPDPVEVGAYYIVAEALTNAAKHSHATEVIVSAHDEDANLYLSVTDNGIGGANAGKGSGLVGLNDRVEALGGKMTITSIPGSGTSLNVTIPVSTVQSAWSSRPARRRGTSGAAL